jgi:antitoxin component YwqK of YwqJK toxin-antitoxin module
MKQIGILLFVCLLGACKNQAEQEEIKTEPEVLTEINGGSYTEYYPGRKQVKVIGHQLEDGTRHGKWQLFSPEGKELSMTYYENGKKTGHSVIRYPNGQVHYYGEYKDGKEVGLWKFYNINGELNYEKDFGTR